MAYRFLRPKYAVTWNKHQLNESQLVSKVKPFHAILTTLADPITEKVLLAAPSIAVCG